MRALRSAHNAGDTNAAKRIAAMINQQNQKSQSESTIGNSLVGGLETAANIGSGIIAEPLAGLAGVAQSLNPFAEEGAGAQAVSDVKVGEVVELETQSQETAQT